MITKSRFSSNTKVWLCNVRDWPILIGSTITVLALVIGIVSLVHSKDKGSASGDLTSLERAFSPADRPLPIQTVRFTLYPQGFYPQKVTAHKGVVAIAIDDLVGGSTVLVEKMTGDARVSLAQARRSENHWRGRGFLNLPPGDYRVLIAERPDHQAELTVEP